MNVFKFSKPKGPGFGISKGYYLSVLCSKATLPSILEIVEPKGAGGAIEGFGVPLSPDKTKADLGRPLERGVYAVATKDRKTVLRLVIVSKEEAGFDPDAAVMSPRAPVMATEAALRIKATWTLGQATFESHDPDVYPALHFQLLVCRRLAELADGVVADPISRRYRLPNELPYPGTTSTSLDPRDIVSVQFRDTERGKHAFTLGMQKLVLPEFEVEDVGQMGEDLAGEFLLGLCQSTLKGQVVTPGARVGAKNCPLEAREGGHDLGLWEGVPVLELLPPTGKSFEDCLRAWRSG